MKSVVSSIVFLLIIFSSRLFSQQVVVNGYFNAADPRNEWIELLVITDNTDMRNWTLRDNNGSQNSWQTAITFQNIAFWNNMRAGTVIMVWNRVISSTSVSHATIDVNKADGYIELSAQDATYFSGGTFGSSPTWAGNSLNIAGSGEIIELRNSSSTHVHGLGHLTTAGADWTAMPTPKLNHENTANSGDAIYVCPGASISDYNGPATGNAFTSRNNSTITFGLPNTCGASASGNTNYWNSLREPIFSSQTVSPTVVGGNPGSISFSWTAATDPNSADNTTGYIVLKNTVNTFTAPSDGTTYTVGGTIGTATVVAQTSNSTTLSYTDNTINSENCYYYRVYAFRYGTDNLNGNSFNASRGRAYNTTNFVSVGCLIVVLPVHFDFFTAEKKNSNVEVKWSTYSELNNKLFNVERSSDGENFETIGTVVGSGTTVLSQVYNWIDYEPLEGNSYYRLRQVDNNGHSNFSTIVLVSNERINYTLFPNPCNSEFFNIKCLNFTDGTFYEMFDSNGKKVTEGIINTTNIIVPTTEVTEGLYFIRVYNGNETLLKSLIID